jgi:UDP-GlcNAc:undecaprenyl-phosphate/decaprenyl-phosphate GlcNAc-1-phosphate transferase
MNEAVLIAPAGAATVSAIAVVALRRAARRLPPDLPNARSLHAVPVPRAGGYAIWLGFVAAAVAFPPAFPGGFAGWFPAWLALAVVSGLDDLGEIGVVPRLTVHALASLWAAAWLLWPSQGGIESVVATLPSWLALALVLAWSANLYNFMDGTDGLAATMGAIGFGAYGLAALTLPGDGDAGGGYAAPALLAVAAAILPFLAVNRPRASMFLGDVGAVPLGFLAAAFGAAGVTAGMWPAWFPLLVFLPFIGDATLTLGGRIRRRERLWEGHRSHFYQRLHQLGAGHAGTLAVYASVMVGTAATALACRVRAPVAGWWALAAWIAVVLMLFATIDYHWRKKTNIRAHP